MLDVESFTRCLFEPFDLSAFLSEHAETQYLHVSGSREKLEKLFGRPYSYDELCIDLERATSVRFAGDQRTRAQQNWTRQTDHVHAPRDQKVIEITLPQAANAIRQRVPAALSITDVHLESRQLSELVHCWANAVRAPQVGDPRLVFFYRGGAGPGVSAHFDEVDAYQLMLEGSKRWRVSRTPVVQHPFDSAYRDPRSNGFLHSNAEPVLTKQGTPLQYDDVDWVEFVSSPGDLIYLPAGTLHETESSGEGSLGLSMFTNAFTLEEFALRSIRKFAGVNPKLWRTKRIARLPDKPDEGIQGAERGHFAALNQALQQHFSEPETEPRLVHELLSESMLLARHQKSTRASVEVEQTTRLRRCSLLSSVQRIDDETLSLHLAGDSLEFDNKRFWPFAVGLHQTLGTFEAAEAADWRGSDLTWDEIQPILQTLLENDLLELADV